MSSQEERVHEMFGESRRGFGESKQSFDRGTEIVEGTLRGETTGLKSNYNIVATNHIFLVSGSKG